MPVRVPLVTDPAPRLLLDGLVDYAGLFPPAALHMAEVVRHYARHRGGEAGWMLGRFVLGVGHFADFEREAEPLLPRDAGALPWRLAAVGSGDLARDVEAIARLNASHRWSLDECSAVVDTVEVRAAAADDVHAIDAAFPHDLTVYVEAPPDADPAPFVAALARTGRRAKLRTGGVVAEAFPSAERVATFIERCVAAGVPFKFTAGLHHALCGTYALTDAPDAAQAPMFGFLNVFLASALTADAGDPVAVRRLLTESSAEAITFGEQVVTWRDRSFDRALLARVREQVAVAFGSCSFTEPVAEVRALGAW
jgi:hypothetical protein